MGSTVIDGGRRWRAFTVCAATSRIPTWGIVRLEKERHAVELDIEGQVGARLDGGHDVARADDAVRSHGVTYQLEAAHRPRGAVCCQRRHGPTGAVC